jgi:Protein of unknown function (DUF2722)
MTHTTGSGRVHSGPSPNSAVTPSYSPTDLSIRDILERWVGTDDTLRAALNAHSSYSHRRAEEERARQEYYRLETRRMEFELLREALRGGMHPTLVPQLFNQDRAATQNLSPISPFHTQDERPLYPTSSLPSYNRHDLPKIDTSNILPPSNRHLVPSQREKFAGPISAPPASMATTSPPPSIFFRHWAPPAPRTAEEIGLRTPREEMEVPSQRYHQHHLDHQTHSPPSTRKSPPLHSSNGISPKRSSQSANAHSRQRSEATLASKLHESRHHPYSARPLQGRKHDSEETGLGATKSNLDRETVMRALREKVAPKKDEVIPKKDEVASKKDEEITPPSSSKEESNKETEKKEVERRKAEQAREVMGVEQLVESNGAAKE